MIVTKANAFRAAFALLTVAAAAGGYLLVQTVVRAQDRAAFTVTIRESAYDRSGKAILTDTVVFGVRSDGSTVRARTLDTPGSHGLATQRFVRDLGRAEEVSIDGLTESTTTAPLRKDAVTFYRRSANCTGGTSPARASLLGYEVVRDVKDTAPSRGRVFREEKWRAPALGCFPLKETLLLGRTEGDLFVAKVNEVTDVRLGEPPPEFFARPVGYVERSPLQRRAELRRRYPEVDCPNCLLKGDEEDDASYYRRQGDRGK